MIGPIRPMEIEKLPLSAMSKTSNRKTMAVVAYNGVRPFQLSVPCEIFGETHYDGANTDVMVCAIDSGPLRTSAGFCIETRHGLDDIRAADVVFIPSWLHPYTPPPQLLIEALKAAHSNGAIIVGLCLGAFVLAEAGLLNGKRATTHWAFAEDFSRRFPDVELVSKSLYVDEGSILTSAGVTAGIDCCLHLARRLLGAHQADLIARCIVASPHRAGDQEQIIVRPLAGNSRDVRLREVISDITANPMLEHTLDSASARLAMSRRSFTRHFRQTMGTNFSSWLINERMKLAQHYLEQTEKSVEQIAFHSGFRSVITFRKQFLERFDVSPAQYRRSFRQKMNHRPD